MSATNYSAGCGVSTEAVRHSGRRTPRKTSLSALAYSVCLGRRRGNQNVEAKVMNDLRKAGCVIWRTTYDAGKLIARFDEGRSQAAIGLVPLNPSAPPTLLREKNSIALHSGSTLEDWWLSFLVIAKSS